MDISTNELHPRVQLHPRAVGNGCDNTSRRDIDARNVLCAEHRKSQCHPTFATADVTVAQVLRNRQAAAQSLLQLLNLRELGIDVNRDVAGSASVQLFFGCGVATVRERPQQPIVNDWTKH